MTTPDAELLMRRNAELRRQVRNQSLTIGCLQERVGALCAGFDAATEEVMRLVLDKPREIINCPKCGTGLTGVWPFGGGRHQRCVLCGHVWATVIKEQP